MSVAVGRTFNNPSECFSNPSEAFRKPTESIQKAFRKLSNPPSWAAVEGWGGIVSVEHSLESSFSDPSAILQNPSGSLQTTLKRILHMQVDGAGATFQVFCSILQNPVVSFRIHLDSNSAPTLSQTSRTTRRN